MCNYTYICVYTHIYTYIHSVFFYPCRELLSWTMSFANRDQICNLWRKWSAGYLFIPYPSPWSLPRPTWPVQAWGPTWGGGVGTKSLRMRVYPTLNQGDRMLNLFTFFWHYDTTSTNEKSKILSRKLHFSIFMPRKRLRMQQRYL